MTQAETQAQETDRAQQAASIMQVICDGLSKALNTIQQSLSHFAQVEDRWNLLEAASQLGRPYVVFHSVADQIVEIEHAAHLFRAARHPKSFVSLGRADHLLLGDERDAVLVADIMCAFGECYVGE